MSPIRKRGSKLFVFLSVFLLTTWFNADSQNLELFSFATAGEVLRIRDSRVLLDISDLPGTQVGDELSSIDNRGNPASRLRVRAIRSNQAVAEVIEGSPQEGQGVRNSIPALPQRSAPRFEDDPFSEPARPTRSSSPAPARAQQPAATRQATFSKTGSGIGGYLTQASHNLSLELQSKNRASLTGSTLNFAGLYDYDYSESFSLRLSLTWLQFNVTGASPVASDCTGPCEIKFNYLSGGGMLQYNLSRWGSRYWVGAGANLMFQMSQNNNLNGTRFTNTTNQNFSVGLGADFGITQESYLPVFVQYDLFFGANSANSLHLGLGYAIRF